MTLKFADFEAVNYIQIAYIILSVIYKNDPYLVYCLVFTRNRNAHLTQALPEKTKMSQI